MGKASFFLFEASSSTSMPSAESLNTPFYNKAKRRVSVGVVYNSEYQLERLGGELVERLGGEWEKTGFALH